MDVKEKIQKAIRNNNGLYEAILGSKNIRSERTDSIWYCLEKTPPLYSNLVTISKEWAPDDIFRSIDLNYENERWDKWSIKDSFAALDLGEYGFTKLFDARWMYLEAAEFTPNGKSTELCFEVVKTEDALSAWRKAWDADEEIGWKIFAPELLNDTRVHFIAGYKGNEIAAGCFVNKTSDVLGVSNFFAPDKNINYWAGLIGFIFDRVEHLDIVGYERKETVDRLRSLGFEPAGNLAVWLKKRNL